MTKPLNESAIDKSSKSLLPANEKLFFSKGDPEDQRLGDFAKSCLLTQIQNSENLAIVGYPDDDGIRLNGGRVGAALAPDQIRQFFYKMTTSTAKMSSSPKAKIEDFGNLNIADQSLKNRHEIARHTVRTLLENKKQIITLGGGHDYGFPDAAGFLDVALQNNERPLMINIDAHLDVRKAQQGSSSEFNSGTPFRRLLEEFPDKFDFVEIGIQPQCNSPHHLQWAKDQGADVISIMDIEEQGLAPCFEKYLATKIKRRPPVWLSVDIDAFSQSEAPGCSQSWARGIHFQDYLKFWNVLSQKCQVLGLGIYEVSPPLDVDHRTSKLAALIMYEAYLDFTKPDLPTKTRGHG